MWQRASAVPAQMWQEGKAQSRCRCGARVGRRGPPLGAAHPRTSPCRTWRRCRRAHRPMLAPRCAASARAGRAATCNTQGVTACNAQHATRNTQRTTHSQQRLSRRSGCSEASAIGVSRPAERPRVSHICAGTGLSTATSAPGLGPPGPSCRRGCPLAAGHRPCLGRPTREPTAVSAARPAPRYPRPQHRSHPSRPTASRRAGAGVRRFREKRHSSADRRGQLAAHPLQQFVRLRMRKQLTFSLAGHRAHTIPLVASADGRQS